MILFLLTAFVVFMPLVEIYFIVQVGQEMGFFPTVAALLVISMVGTALVKREGIRVYRQFMESVRAGKEPTREIVHGVCILAAGVFLLAPGFISDILGILLLLPPVRALFARAVLHRTRKIASVIKATHSGRRVESRGYLPSAGDVIDVDPFEGDNGA
jgi:UPF0716 protein FxsA